MKSRVQNRQVTQPLSRRLPRSRSTRPVTDARLMPTSVASPPVQRGVHHTTLDLDRSADRLRRNAAAMGSRSASRVTSVPDQLSQFMANSHRATGSGRRQFSKKTITLISMDSVALAFGEETDVTSSIITVATMKGGSGKSTVASCLAAHWQLEGRRPSIIDADPQRSIARLATRERALGGVPVVEDASEDAWKTAAPSRRRRRSGHHRHPRLPL